MGSCISVMFNKALSKEEHPTKPYPRSLSYANLLVGQSASPTQLRHPLWKGRQQQQRAKQVYVYNRQERAKAYHYGSWNSPLAKKLPFLPFLSKMKPFNGGTKKCKCELLSIQKRSWSHQNKYIDILTNIWYMFSARFQNHLCICGNSLIHAGLTTSAMPRPQASLDIVGFN